MPIAIIAVVIVGAAVAAGIYITTSSEPTPDTTLATDVESRPVEEETNTTDEADTPDGSDESDNTTYANGTYETTESYFTPSRVQHNMEITLTIADNIVTDAQITYDGAAPETGHHTRFDAAYKSEVVGKNLDDISLARTGGASLTSNAFNEALETIKADARS